MADQSSSKPSRGCNKLRVIGRIRGFTEQESKSLNEDSKNWITVTNPQGDAGTSTVAFESQSTSRKNVYELDYCYEQNEETDVIYSRELKPLISKAFKGQNVSVIALGARGSGKTYSIQGSQGNHGLAVRAMSDILCMAGESGKLVYVSLYELTYDHAHDILDPKRPEVQVMDDGHGKINLKGLSKVVVKTISDFESVYFSTRSVHVQNSQKGQLDQSQHCNLKGLMIHICADGVQKNMLSSKINFVDLAGYEDPKKSSTDGIKLAEVNRSNKSLHGLLKVINALKANELRLPYRECKITRILQDSLGCTSHILLLACLNPIFCQDTISSLSLVSRSYRNSNQILTDSTNRNQSTTKVKELSSLQRGKVLSASLSAKKQFGHSRVSYEKKPSSIVKGRKLFDGETRTGSRKLQSAQKSGKPPKLDLVVPPFLLEEDLPVKSISEVNKALELKENEHVEGLGSVELENTLSESAADAKAIVLAEKDVLPVDSINHQEVSLDNILDEETKMHREAATSCEERNTLEKNNESSSPPLSEQIKELANNLKSLCSSPLRIKMSEETAAPYSSQMSEETAAPYSSQMPEETAAPYSSQMSEETAAPYSSQMPEETAAPYSSQVDQKDIAEPKTPLMTLSSAAHCTPKDTFGNRSTGVKHSLVQEYLKFLNSASKEQLKSIKGIGEKRATYILELREESPKPFKNLDDLQDIGLSAKQVKGLMQQVAGGLFN